MKSEWPPYLMRCRVYYTNYRSCTESASHKGRAVCGQPKVKRMIFAYDKHSINANDWVSNGVPWLMHTPKSLCFQYCTHKLENLGSKKLTTVCHYCTIMYTCMLRNQSSIYSLITHGKHFSIYFIASIRVCLTSTFFQNLKNHFVELILKVGWAFAGCDLWS